MFQDRPTREYLAKVGAWTDLVSALEAALTGPERAVLMVDLWALGDEILGHMGGGRISDPMKLLILAAKDRISMPLAEQAAMTQALRAYVEFSSVAVSDAIVQQSTPLKSFDEWVPGMCSAD